MANTVTPPEDEETEDEEPEEACPTCLGAGTLPQSRIDEMMARPGKTGPATTSRVAGKTPRKGTQRYQVLRHLASSDATAYELSALMDIAPNQIATRLCELREDTFVEYRRDPWTKEVVERPTTRGNTGMVHKITAAGRYVLRNYGAKPVVASGADLMLRLLGPIDD